MLRRNKALILVSCATLFFFMIIIRNVCLLQNEEYILTVISRGEKRVSQAVDARWQPVLNTRQAYN
jgi:hypothetical protein